MRNFIMKFKKCKTCKSENELNELICTHCGGTVFEEYSKKNSVVKTKKLKLLIEGFPLKIEHENSVGRAAIGDKVLAMMPTVSRKHVKFILKDNVWFVKDLNSLNGTYLTTIENQIKEKTEIKDGDILFLSRSVKIIIKIEGE